MQYQRNLYMAEKYIQWATIPSLTIRDIFIRLADIASETREMSRNSKKFDLAAVQGHAKSSILVSMESP